MTFNYKLIRKFALIFLQQLPLFYDVYFIYHMILRNDKLCIEDTIKQTSNSSEIIPRVYMTKTKQTCTI